MCTLAPAMAAFGISMVKKPRSSYKRFKMLYLCRHGETQWTIEGKHTSYTDLHLTANGKIEALALHQKLAKGRFDQIISSPRIRALETAEPLKPTVKSPTEQTFF